jgi:ubiquinone/menaquinone biosynthesis C-methylase UbiE
MHLHQEGVDRYHREVMAFLDQSPPALMARLRRAYMQTTSLSIPWTGRDGFVRLLYRAWSSWYDASIAWDPAYRANAARMLALVVQPGDRVLDVGTGTGLLAELAAKWARSYVGVDFSGSMLSRAARKLAPLQADNVSLRWGDARALAFDDEAFDAVVSSFMLPHFPRSQKVEVLRELVRVLRPGGRLGLFLAQGEVAPMFSTRAELEQLMPAAGVHRVEIEDRDDVYRIVVARKPNVGSG